METFIKTHDFVVMLKEADCNLDKARLEYLLSNFACADDFVYPTRSTLVRSKKEE